MLVKRGNATDGKERLNGGGWVPRWRADLPIKILQGLDDGLGVHCRPAEQQGVICFAVSTAARCKFQKTAAHRAPIRVRAGRRLEVARTLASSDSMAPAARAESWPEEPLLFCGESVSEDEEEPAAIDAGVEGPGAVVAGLFVCCEQARSGMELLCYQGADGPCLPRAVFLSWFFGEVNPRS